jgi:hypothetical protein
MVTHTTHTESTGNSSTETMEDVVPHTQPRAERGAGAMMRGVGPHTQLRAESGHRTNQREQRNNHNFTQPHMTTIINHTQRGLVITDAAERRVYLSAAGIFNRVAGASHMDTETVMAYAEWYTRHTGTRTWRSPQTGSLIMLVTRTGDNYVPEWNSRTYEYITDTIRPTAAVTRVTVWNEEDIVTTGVNSQRRETTVQEQLWAEQQQHNIAWIGRMREAGRIYFTLRVHAARSTTSMQEHVDDIIIMSRSMSIMPTPRANELAIRRVLPRAAPQNYPSAAVVTMDTMRLSQGAVVTATYGTHFIMMRLLTSRTSSAAGAAIADVVDTMHALGVETYSMVTDDDSIYNESLN